MKINWKSTFLAAGLGLACALGAMIFTPWDCLPLSPSEDVVNHTEYMASAAEALAEGQGLLREVPRVSRNEEEVYRRYALFQFYSVAPYTLGGLLVLMGMLPYHALAAVVGFSFFLGFLGAYLLARERGCGPWAGLACGAVFSFAPYHLADWYARFAVPEVIAFGLLPWVFWAGLKTARSKSPAGLLPSALAWVVLIHTHNIFHVWGMVFFGAYFLWLAVFKQVDWKGLARLGAAYGLALAASAAIFAPVFFVGRYFYVGGSYNPGHEALLAPLWVLLSPVHVASAKVMDEVPLLSMQVGWPALAGVLALLLHAGRKAFKDAELAAFVLAFLCVWSPVNFWRFSGPLIIVQFPYRLLTFTSLFGAVLAGRAYNGLAPGRQKKWLALALVLPAVLALPVFSGLKITGQTALAEQAQQAEIGTAIRPNKNIRYGFHLFPVSLLKYQELAWDSVDSLKTRQWPQGVTTESLDALPESLTFTAGRVARLEMDKLAGRAIVVLPALWYPGLYEARVDGQPRLPGRVGSLLAVEMFSGESRVEYQLAGLGWANNLSCLAWLVMACLLIHAWWKKYTSLPGPASPR